MSIDSYGARDRLEVGGQGYEIFRIDAVEGADRVTAAVTVWALLELYKRGEAAWEQDEPFGPITVTADARQRAAA